MRHLLMAAAAAFVLAAPAEAATFIYNGVIGESSLPGVVAGEAFKATFVVQAAATYRDGAVQYYGEQAFFAFGEQVFEVFGRVSLFAAGGNFGSGVESRGDNFAFTAFLYGGPAQVTSATLTLNGTTTAVNSLRAAVPEPASWATMIAGFGLVGAGMRRRRHGVRASTFSM